MMKIKQKIKKVPAGALEAAGRFHRTGHLQQAEEIYRRLLREHPDDSSVCLSLALVLQERGNLGEAAAFYQKTLGLNPRIADAHYNLGSIFQQRGQLDEALACYERAVQLSPSHAMACNNLGSILQQRGRLDEAIVMYKKALGQNPALLSACNNLGLAYQEQGRYEDAMAYHRKALSLNPGHAAVRFNIGVLQLMHGDLERGWEGYEWRKKMQGYRARGFSQPSWDGSEIKGRSVLLYSEKGYEGFGDVIQFIRYARLIAERGGKVIVECRKEIRTLLVDVAGVEDVVTCDDRLPVFDLHCPFLSLPFVFRTTLEDIPYPTCYISVKKDLADKWGERIARDRSGFNAGLVWSGDLRHPRVQYRSCPLDTFRPLSELEGIALFSLQKGEASAAAKHPPAGMKITDLSDVISDFSDAAACMENLDLVVTVDTAAAHLAGALGRPVWLLLPFVPEWRWMLDREDSPWYRSMRIFRQPAPGDWDSIITRVTDELRKIVSDKL